MVAGKWDHSVNYQPANPLDLFTNHRIVRRDGRATWELNGRDLSMRWPRADAPGGAWVDQCILAADGQSFVGRNQRGMIVRGIRLSQVNASTNATAGSWRFFDVYNKGATIAEAVSVERDGSVTFRNNVRGFCLASRRVYEELELSLEFQLSPDARGSASVYVASRLPNPAASDWREQIPKGFEFKLGPARIGELWLAREDFELELPLGRSQGGSAAKAGAEVVRLEHVASDVRQTSQCDIQGQRRNDQRDRESREHSRTRRAVPKKRCNTVSKRRRQNCRDDGRTSILEHYGRMKPVLADSRIPDG